jgi:hypothetical protein
VRERPGCAVSPQNLQLDEMANIFGAARASRLCGRAREHPATGRHIGPRPVAGCSAGPFRSQGHSVVVSFAACNDVACVSGSNLSAARFGRTYNHCINYNSFTPIRVVVRPNACSANNRLCGDACHGRTAVTERLQQSTHAPSRQWTPAPLARQRPDVGPACELFLSSIKQRQHPAARSSKSFGSKERRRNGSHHIRVGDSSSAHIPHILHTNCTTSPTRACYSRVPGQLQNASFFTPGYRIQVVIRDIGSNSQVPYSTIHLVARSYHPRQMVGHCSHQSDGRAWRMGNSAEMPAVGARAPRNSKQT